jgi:hypothetical protein
MDTLHLKTVDSTRRQILSAGICVGALPALSVFSALPAWAAPIKLGEIDREQKVVLSGRLTGNNGAAISGAVIELEGVKMSTLTDADGRFMLISPLPMNHSVAVLVTERASSVPKQIEVMTSRDIAGVRRASVSLKI